MARSLPEQITKGLRGKRIMPIVAANYGVYQMWRRNIAATEDVRMVDIHSFITDGWLYEMRYITDENQLQGLENNENLLVIRLNGASFNKNYKQVMKIVDRYEMRVEDVDATLAWASPFDKVEVTQ